MSAKAILRASTGDTSKIRDEIERKYDDILEDSDIIILANSVAAHLLGNIMDPKIHNAKMKTDGGWAEHLRKKGMLPVALEDVFGANMTPAPAPAATPVATGVMPVAKSNNMMDMMDMMSMESTDLTLATLSDNIPPEIMIQPQMLNDLL